MGYVYTDPNNAISISSKTLGLPGKKGVNGAKGPDGNSWVVGTASDPNSLFSFRDQNGAVVPVSGNILATEDHYLNSLTGEVWTYDQTTSSWTKETYNLMGSKGTPDYLSTEVSFSKDKAIGWTLDIPNEKTLIGHLIWPGSIIAGNINTVKVLLGVNSDTRNIKIYLQLVNLGVSAGSTIDDIIIADQVITSSGSGNLDSYRIISLNVIPANVPENTEVLGLFATMTDTEQGKQAKLKQISSSYNNEIAIAYKESLDYALKTDRNAFYSVLDKNGIESVNELPEDKQSRIYSKRKEVTKKDTATKAAMGEFSKDSSTLSGGKPYESFNRLSTATTKGGTISPINPTASFGSEIIISHLSIR